MKDNADQHDDVKLSTVCVRKARVFPEQPYLRTEYIETYIELVPQYVCDSPL